MRTSVRMLALALLMVPAGLTAQQGAPPAGAGTNPIERLLERRTELALTGDQVEKLEAIRQKNAAHEKDLVAKVTDARGVPPGVPIRSHGTTAAERKVLRHKTQAVRPQMQELRQLHLQEIQEACAVLTADQNAKAWEPGLRPHDGKAPGMTPHGPGHGTRSMGRGSRAGL